VSSRLVEVGFRQVGEWSLQNEEPRFSLSAEATSHNVLYSFVSGDDALYIGKTTIALQDRMYQYENPGRSQLTNIRVNGLLKETLSDGTVVHIYALRDDGSMNYRGFHLNLAAGLEDSLISGLKPKWNKVGK
jgi:hypothetical protein